MTEDLGIGQATSASPQSAAAIVGREREQVVLREDLTAALAGRGRFVLLSGEAASARRPWPTT